LAPFVLSIADGDYGVLFGVAGICAVLAGAGILRVRRVR
jgi:hypothetical protein